MSWGTAYQTELNESKSAKTTVFALYIFWIPHAKISRIPESGFTLNGGSILVCCSNEPDTCQQNLVKVHVFNTDQSERTKEDGRGWKQIQQLEKAKGNKQLDVNPPKRQCRKPGGGRSGTRPNFGRKKSIQKVSYWI